MLKRNNIGVRKAAILPSVKILSRFIAVFICVPVRVTLSLEDSWIKISPNILSKSKLGGNVYF